MVDGKVEMIPEVAEALDAFNEAGFAACSPTPTRAACSCPS
jgi:hypothetical protein